MKHFYNEDEQVVDTVSTHLFHIFQQENEKL